MRVQSNVGPKVYSSRTYESYQFQRKRKVYGCLRIRYIGRPRGVRNAKAMSVSVFFILFFLVTRVNMRLQCKLAGETEHPRIHFLTKIFEQ